MNYTEIHRVDTELYREKMFGYLREILKIDLKNQSLSLCGSQ
jgi:hypothetical protein